MSLPDGAGIPKCTPDEGRLRLNEQLRIAFDAIGTFETGLLCTESRVAIELDGAQHLADAAAYPRDHRKNQLRQEHGSFVLRFLAEDVGKDLDRVLDASGAAWAAVVSEGMRPLRCCVAVGLGRAARPRGPRRLRPSRCRAPRV